MTLDWTNCVTVPAAPSESAEALGSPSAVAAGVVQGDRRGHIVQLGGDGDRRRKCRHRLHDPVDHRPRRPWTALSPSGVSDGSTYHLRHIAHAGSVSSTPGPVLEDTLR